MKKLIGLIALTFIGCAQLQHGQIQPVIFKDAKNKIMYTTCSGAVEDWASCFNKAKGTCSKGYEILDQKENAQGGKRELTFQCKNK